jgi:hypothetical protein
VGFWVFGLLIWVVEFWVLFLVARPRPWRRPLTEVATDRVLVEWANFGVGQTRQTSLPSILPARKCASALRWDEVLGGTRAAKRGQQGIADGTCPNTPC